MNEALVRKFSPVLFLHPMEKFVPVDAKRFVENASLWSAKGMFDDKTMWGNPGSDPTIRQPIVPAGELRGATSEGGKVIDEDSILPPVGEEMFLELGGWKNAAEAHEAGVTATTSNLYSDRNAIADMYAASPLKESRFWYHAEMFDGPRLARLVQEAGPPDLSRFVTPNSALLCYYFLFPAHQQSVATGYCDDRPLSAAEAVCHAGDWQCMAILFEGDGTGQVGGYTPKYFGCTGSRHVPSPGATQFRPYAFDDDGYTVMNVERWRPMSGPAMNMPELDDNHPRLFVALGTHGLYTAPGTYTLEPFNGDTTSRWCGTFDTPGMMPPGWGQPEDTFAADAGAFLAKVLGGLGLGGALGGLAGPALAAAGIISAAMEGVIPEPGTGISVVGTWDPPDPDQVPAQGAGLTIRPAGVNVAGAGLAIEEWQENQTHINGRTYDYLVDRNKHRWLPNDDHEHGFRGRWGQHVTSDTLPRRSGPKFPDYLKMFLMALADGDARGLFTDQ